MNLKSARIYHDGSHFVAIPSDAFPHQRKKSARKKKALRSHRNFDGTYCPSLCLPKAPEPLAKENFREFLRAFRTGALALPDCALNLAANGEATCEPLRNTRKIIS